ncbi:MAG: ATP-binding protein [Proteobacteria bacterium]|jgi:predicted AAA+ superfamily ATPase|nr:ATP-binding protein [Pseudomonadota bacterium]
MDKYLPRILDNVLDEHLQTFGAVYMRGPKWVGKTTTALQKANSSIKLQNPALDELREMGFSFISKRILEGKNPRLIDEWQLIPQTWDAVRYQVDEQAKKGLYILTGSTVPPDDETRHSGTGRISWITMYPMSLFESNESSGAVSLSLLFAKATLVNSEQSSMTVEELAFILCRGGWPNSVARKESDALLIGQQYITALAESDLSRVTDSRKSPQRILNLLASYARNVSTLADNRTIIQDVESTGISFSESTFHEYSNGLKRLFVIEDIPAWSPNIRSKTTIRAKAKREFVDPSLAVAALGLSPSRLLDDLKYMGFLFETLCIRDLRVYSQHLGGFISYYHDRYGLECDCVLHLRDGRFALIEFKLGGKLIDEGATHLLKLKSLLEENNLQAPSFLMVITAGKFAYQRKDGVLIVPLATLGP